MGGPEAIGQRRAQLGELDRRQRRGDPEGGKEALDVSREDLATQTFGSRQLRACDGIGGGICPVFVEEPPPSFRDGILRRPPSDRAPARGSSSDVTGSKPASPPASSANDCTRGFARTCRDRLDMIAWNRFVLAREVRVDRADRITRPIGDFGERCRAKPLLGEDIGGRVHDAAPRQRLCLGAGQASNGEGPEQVRRLATRRLFTSGLWRLSQFAKQRYDAGPATRGSPVARALRCTDAGRRERDPAVVRCRWTRCSSRPAR